MWVERKPYQGETVKIEFAEFTKLGTLIGVFLRHNNGFAIIDFGNVIRNINSSSTFFVWENNKIN